MSAPLSDTLILVLIIGLVCKGTLAVGWEENSKMLPDTLLLYAEKINQRPIIRLELLLEYFLRKEMHSVLICSHCRLKVCQRHLFFVARDVITVCLFSNCSQ